MAAPDCWAQQSPKPLVLIMSTGLFCRLPPSTWGQLCQHCTRRKSVYPPEARGSAGVLQSVLERSAMADGGVEGLAVPSFLIEEYDSLPTIITKGSDLEDAKYIKGLQVVIKDLADRDNVVIVGRGSSIILRDETGRAEGRVIRQLVGLRIQNSGTRAPEPSGSRENRYRTGPSSGFLLQTLFRRRCSRQSGVLPSGDQHK